MTTFGLTALLTFLVACLTAAATAIRSASRIWIRHWVERSLTATADGSALVVERPQRLLIAVATGIAGLTFGLGAVLGLREDRGALLTHLLWAALALVVFGQLLPRAIARRWSAIVLPVLLPPVIALEWCCRPIFRPLMGRGSARGTTPHDATEEARENLDELLREGELEGVGEATESAIITGVVEFGMLRAQDVMTPREDIVAIERSRPAAEVVRLMAQSQYSRVPVFDGDLDHCVGLVHSFDVLAAPDAPLERLRGLARWSEETPAQEMLRRMLRERVHLAIIQDPGGRTVGLVTLEDLVEELVGEISDEHDEPQGVAQ